MLRSTIQGDFRAHLGFDVCFGPSNRAVRSLLHICCAAARMRVHASVFAAPRPAGAAMSAVCDAARAVCATWKQRVAAWGLFVPRPAVRQPAENTHGRYRTERVEFTVSTNQM
jgi:hypothetical protein